MKLYQFPFSPACQKVVAFAREVGVPLELATVEIFKGEARTPAMLAKNPNGKLPILEDGAFDAPPAARTADDEWLEPAPSAWLMGASPEDGSPASRYTMKESVALAFVAALQVLTPPQRAVLLLRDVVGLSASETAEALACSVSSANSTLHRARVALEERVRPRADWSPEAGMVDRTLLERYMRAWDKGDLDAIIALLHEDVTLSMPPSPTWIAGRADVARFFTSRLMQALRERRFRTALVDANGGMGAAYYRLGDDGEAPFFALQVLEAKDGRIRAIDHFTTASSVEAFFASGLARTIEAKPG